MAGERVVEFGRFLASQSDEEEYALASKIGQIFSGCLFGFVTIYLIVSNSTRLSYIHRASIEKRLSTCCQINTIVAAISCFLNFFQLTEVDNWALPGQRQFTVDVARPIEWILTCPMLQLSLVLMGGSRIPEYRRMLMPASAATVLVLGALTLFVESPWTYCLYAVSTIVHICAMCINVLQIHEHSKGQEGLFSGDSEFRKATLILMATWFPFPIWYFLSPEGTGLISGITVVQMGWAALNIIAKFTMIFYIQRIKDNYCNRLKVRRAVQQEKLNARGGVDSSKSFYAIEPFDFDDEVEPVTGKVTSAELGGCVMETMQFLGMGENGERFLRLLRQANIYTLEELAQLSSADCERLLLPIDLIEALQKRHKVWSLEMVDDAEIGIEQGEKHYKKKEASERYKEGDEETAYVWYAKGKGKGKMALPNMASPDFEDEETRRYIMSIVEIVEQRNAERNPERQVRNREDGFTSATGEAIKTTQDFDAIMIGSTFEEQLESRMLSKFERLISDLGSKVDNSVMRVDELMKNQERSHSLLEAKMEYVFASGSIKHREENRNDLSVLLEMFGDRLSNTKSNTKDAIMEKLEELQQMQASLLGSLGGNAFEDNMQLDNMILRQQRQMVLAQRPLSAGPMPMGSQQGAGESLRQNQQAQWMEREVEARLQQRLQETQMGNQGRTGHQGVSDQNTPNFATQTSLMNGNRTPTPTSNSRPQSSSGNGQVSQPSNARRDGAPVVDDGDAFW